MEQQCKRSGLRFTSRDGEDRINELPEALLLHILSKVSTETAIATSVLSKQWRSLWKMVPKLKFDSHYHQSSSSENIYKSLILHKAPFLESLHIKVDYKPNAVDIAAWIGIAFARRVRELVLDVDLGKLKFVDFPGVLFSYNDTLEVLKLKNCILLDFPSRVCFKSLRVLHLWFVHFQDFDRVSISNFFSGCPCLEDLFVKRISKWDVDMFIIDVLPSLRRLTLDDDYEPNEWDRGYMINVPSLKYLHIKGLKDLDYCKIENALEELVEASIVNVSDITKENILASLTSAKHLTLHISPLKVKYPIGSIFYRLVSLELRTNDEEWWNLLSLMLVGSPKLQILKLVDESYYREKGTVDRRWNQPLCVPECLLMHLETFVWTRYEWGRKDEKEVATYILNNARRLKKATLSTKPIRSKEKLEMRCEMLKELASEVSVSSSCQLVLESDTYI